MDRKIVELLIAGKSLREIRELLKVGDRRVRRLRIMAEEYGYLSAVELKPLPAYPEALFPDDVDRRELKTSEADQVLLGKKDWIIERLHAGWSPITVFEEIGLSIGRSSFYRFLHRHGLVKMGEHHRRVTPEILHRPGEALLLDWGKLRDVICPETGRKRVLWAFVGVLGFSRFMMVRLVWSNDTETTLLAIESMLREIGGAAARITSDNPKCFALEADRYEPLLNPAFERFAAHYGTTVECLPPADPKKKGKVERPMPYVRRLYEAHGMDWRGLDESQDYMNRKVAIANERKHGTTLLKPIEQLVGVEAGALKALPALAWSPEEVTEAVVRRDGHVRFANKYYSLPEKLIGEKVTVLGGQAQVSIYFKGKLVETHPRVIDPNQSKSTKEHHLKPWERTMRDGSLYRKRAAALGPDVERFVLAILAQGQGFIDTRKIWGVLSLDKAHSGAAINEACRQSLDLGSVSYRMVKNLLALQGGAELADGASRGPAIAPKNQNKFVRPMSVYEEQMKLLIQQQKGRINQL